MIRPANLTLRRPWCRSLEFSSCRIGLKIGRQFIEENEHCQGNGYHIKSPHKIFLKIWLGAFKFSYFKTRAT